MVDRPTVGLRIAVVGVAMIALSAADVSAQISSRQASGRNRMISNGGLSQVPDQVAPTVDASDSRLQPAKPIAPVGEDRSTPPASSSWQPDQLVSPGGLSGTMNTVLVLTVVSVVPSILILTTCFVRFSIILGLLRQALGTQQLPSNQVLMGLSFFLTVLVMAPVWQASYTEGIKPYTSQPHGQPAISFEQAFANAARPIRNFMSDQIHRVGNDETVWMLLDYQHGRSSAAESSPRRIESYDDVPLPVLLPAYLLSELKTAFVTGFQLYLPFVIIDLVVAAVLAGMGLATTSPTMVSLPCKLLLFVLIGGWDLTVGMMLESVRSVSG
jgi:flagellar biosynthetic protein FliP